eukprot:scaffold207145_cov16-Tisochrysis_lutea.AAC.3
MGILILFLMGIQWVVSHLSSHASRPPESSASSGPHPRFSIVWTAELDGCVTSHIKEGNEDTYGRGT